MGLCLSDIYVVRGGVFGISFFWEGDSKYVMSDFCCDSINVCVFGDVELV